MLDIDPQSSLSEILVSNGGFGSLKGLPENETINYIFDLYISKIERYPSIEFKFTNSLIKSYKGLYDFVPSSLFYRDNMGLDTLAIRMKKDIQYLSILKNWVDTIKEEYDFIFIDCPPSNNLITQSAFLMSDYYIIPTVLDGLSTNGVIHYINTISNTYDEYCGENSSDYLVAKHFFGEKPQLIGIFYNLLRAQVNYDDAKSNFESEIKTLFPNNDGIILNGEINNYIDIARQTQEGNVSIKKADFANLTSEIIKNFRYIQYKAEGVDSMYLTLENINNLNGIITEINSIEDEEQKEKFLNEHIEDTALFLDTIKKVNKQKFSIDHRKVQRKEEIETDLYKEEEIYNILCEKNNVEIMKEYSLSDLKKMYASIYKKTPTSSYTKERIVGVLRNRMHNMKRAEAFATLAEEREKKMGTCYK